MKAHINTLFFRNKGVNLKSVDSKHNYRIVLVGSKKDKDYRDQIITKLQNLNIDVVDFNKFHKLIDLQLSEKKEIALVFLISKSGVDEKRDFDIINAKTTAQVNNLKCFPVLLDLNVEDYHNIEYWKEFPWRLSEESKINPESEYREVIEELNQPIHFFSEEIEECLPQIIWRVRNYFTIIQSQSSIKNTQEDLFNKELMENGLVFISSKSEDYNIAMKVSKCLHNINIKTFLAPIHLRNLGNADYLATIDEQIELCQHLVVVTSSADHTRSRWVEYEWKGFNLEHLRGKKNGNLFTILTDGSEYDDLPLGLKNKEIVYYNPKKDTCNNLTKEISPLIKSTIHPGPYENLEKKGIVEFFKSSISKHKKLLIGSLVLLGILGLISLFLFTGLFAILSDSPSISFTNVPPIKSFDFVSGRVSGVSFTKNAVALYIYVPGYGWVNKPYMADPLTSINSDGTWICDYRTASGDENATKFIVFLVPEGYNVPLLNGDDSIPKSLYSFPYSQATR